MLTNVSKSLSHAYAQMKTRYQFSLKIKIVFTHLFNVSISPAHRSNVTTKAFTSILVTNYSLVGAALPYASFDSDTWKKAATYRLLKIALFHQ